MSPPRSSRLSVVIDSANSPRASVWLSHVIAGELRENTTLGTALMNSVTAGMSRRATPEVQNSPMCSYVTRPKRSREPVPPLTPEPLDGRLG